MKRMHLTCILLLILCGSVLAVAAAAWAMNLPVDLICAGLRTFDAAPGCIGN